MLNVLLGRIQAERLRQQEQKGWSPEHDDDHDGGQLAMAASSFAAPADIYGRYGNVFQGDSSDRGWRGPYNGLARIWPWGSQRAKEKHDRKQQLIIAAALIVAELERLERKEP